MLPLPFLVEIITRGPVTLERGLDIEEGVPNPVPTDGWLPLAFKVPI